MKRISLVPGAMLFAAIGIMPQKTGGCVEGTEKPLKFFYV